MSTSAQVAADTIASSGEEWRKIQSDPVRLEGLLSREAIVRCEGNRCHAGVIQAIDPSSKSIIVAELDARKEVTTLVLCMGPSIEDVVVGDGASKHGPVVEKLFKQQNVEELSSAELTVLRDNLLSYLRSHQLPVEVDAENSETLRIAQIAHIVPPYSVKEVYCQNEIVMERITKLVKEMPPPPPQSASGTIADIAS